MRIFVPEVVLYYVAISLLYCHLLRLKEGENAEWGIEMPQTKMRSKKYPFKNGMCIDSKVQTRSKTALCFQAYVTLERRGGKVDKNLSEAHLFPENHRSFPEQLWFVVVVDAKFGEENFILIRRQCSLKRKGKSENQPPWRQQEGGSPFSPAAALGSEQ